MPASTMKKLTYKVIVPPLKKLSLQSVSQLGTTDVLVQTIFVVRGHPIRFRMFG